MPVASTKRDPNHAIIDTKLQETLDIKASRQRPALDPQGLADT